MKAEWNMKVIRRRRDGNSKGSQEKMDDFLNHKMDDFLNHKMPRSVHFHKAFYHPKT